MNNERIETALAQATDTKAVLIGSGVIKAVPETFTTCFGSQTAIVVADENTWTAAGQTVDEQLRAAGLAALEPYLFPGQPMLYADYQNVQKLTIALKAHNAIPVAVGSGTLNDIAKLASHEAGRPYMSVATAASMDGYTSFGASISKDGYKQTMSCPAPYAVVADVDVLAAAPLAMTASGYADLLGKVTAGADWLVADALGAEPIEPYVWSLVQDMLRTWTGQPHLLAEGNPQAFEYLIEGLILVGLGMQAHQSSRCASGSEHQFSHLWEMEGLPHGDKWISHGFKVGLGTISSAALYECLLKIDFSQLDVEAVVQNWPSPAELEQQVRATQQNPGLAENAVKETQAKYLTAAQLVERLTTLRQRWPKLQQQLKAQLLPAAEIRALLQAAGSPIDPSEIHVDSSRLKYSYFAAQQIRRRYTVLDLAFETGCFAGCVADLFAPGGFWAN